MKYQLNWNRERWRTRDLLLEYDTSIMPPHPRAAGLSMIYPWENSSLAYFCEQLYQLATASGYVGSKEEFTLHFGAFLNGTHQIIYDIYANFPVPGDSDKLYFDLEEKILYYWDAEYIPVNAMLIVNTTLEGGGA